MVATSVFVLLLGVCCALASMDIFEAVSKSDVDAIKEIIASKPDQLNKIGSGGQTPLMNAVLSGKTSVVEYLLYAGADVTIPEQDGYTPLHGAGFQGRPEITQLLIDHGLNVLDFHKDGYIPMHRACWGEEDRHTETVKVFLDAGVKPRYRAYNQKTCSAMTKNAKTKELLNHYGEKSKKTSMSKPEL